MFYRKTREQPNTRNSRRWSSSNSAKMMMWRCPTKWYTKDSTTNPNTGKTQSSACSGSNQDHSITGPEMTTEIGPSTDRGINNREEDRDQDKDREGDLGREKGQDRRGTIDSTTETNITEQRWIEHWIGQTITNKDTIERVCPTKQWITMTIFRLCWTKWITIMQIWMMHRWVLKNSWIWWKFRIPSTCPST